MASDRFLSAGRVRTAALAVAAFALLAPAIAAGAPSGGWLTGAELRKKLLAPVDVTLAAPLRQALEAVSRAHRVAILIDRRVDPDRTVELRLQSTPLGEALAVFAQREDLGLSVLGSVVFLGPPQTTARLRTLAALRSEDLRKLPATAARRLLAAGAMKWDDFAQPRDLLGELAREGRVTLEGLDQVPHDLWAAADLPPLPLVDRLTLVAVQFELTFRLSADGNTLTLVPVPDEVALVRSYPGGPAPEAVARRYASLAPGAEIKTVGEMVYVKALLEDHERIAAPPGTERPGQGPAQVPRNIDETRFDSFRIQNIPAAAVLKHVAEQLNLELRIDQAALRQAGVSLETRVSISGQQMTVDQLLSKIAEQAGLRIVRKGATVEVGPAK